MRRTLFTKFTSALVAAAHLVCSVLIVAPGLVHAQSETIDVDPPTIQLEAVVEGVRGETQVFSATVEDNNQVSSMTLHYRFGKDTSYLSVPMSAILGTSIYTASIDTSDTTAGVIQYYMEARDAGGNRTVQGFAFDPFERALIEDNALVANEPIATAPVEPVASTRMSTQRKIIYGVLGVLVVGGLAAASSGGSSGSGTSSTGQVDLTIFVDKFQ